MEFTVEDISPVKKKVSITVAPEEVNAAIMGAVALLRDSVKLDGFRKGKVPAEFVEKRYHDKIYSEARQDLVNVHINDVIQQLGVTPVGPINMTGDLLALKKGEPYTYGMEFEIMPQFDLPPYEGVEVEEEETVLDPARVDALLERVRNGAAKLKVVDGDAPAADGQIANIDFEIFENGEPLPDMKTSNFDLEIGSGQSLEDFEKLVKGIPAGHTGEGDVHFPDNFLDQKLAGKTLKVKITVHAVKERELPELNDDFAKSMGQETMEKLRDVITRGYSNSLRQLNKSAAQKKILDQLLKQTDFPLPPSYVDMESRFLLADQAERLQRQGKSIAAMGKSFEQLLEDVRPSAEEFARGEILLLTVAKKENLEVTEREVANQVYKDCLQNGADFQSTLKQMDENGILLKMRDRMLADKAMDLIYAKAKVTMVEPEVSKPVTGEAPAQDVSPAESPQATGQPQEQENGDAEKTTGGQSA